MDSVHSAPHRNGPRVLLVDDHDLFRRGLRCLLEDQILAGACGYLLKHSSINDFLRGICAASVWPRRA
jgi:hypothetical protein